MRSRLALVLTCTGALGVTACLTPVPSQDAAVLDATGDAAGVDAGVDASGVDSSTVDRWAGDQGAPDLRPHDVVADDRWSADAGVADASGAADTGYSVAELIGQVLVQEIPASGYPHGVVAAALYDRPSVDISQDRWFALVEANAECELRSAAFRGDFGVCNPECSAGDSCMPDLSCEAPAQSVSAGTVSVTGLVRDVALTPLSWGYDTDSNFPGGEVFATGAAIEAGASGGAMASFALQASGVEPMALAGPSTITIRDNQPLEVRWQAGVRGDSIEIVITPYIHIFTYMFIRCRVADTGSYTIPWSLLQHLPDDSACGHGECAGYSKITRYSEDVMHTGSGLLRLRVESRLPLPVANP